MRNKSCVNLVSCHMNTGPGRALAGHLFKQPSTSREPSNLPSMCRRADMESCRQAPAQDPRSKPWPPLSLETQPACSKDSLLRRRTESVAGTKSYKDYIRKGEGEQTTNRPRLHTCFFFLSLLEDGFFPSYSIKRKRKCCNFLRHSTRLGKKKKKGGLSHCSTFSTANGQTFLPQPSPALSSTGSQKPGGGAGNEGWGVL